MLLITPRLPLSATLWIGLGAIAFALAWYLVQTIRERGRGRAPARSGPPPPPLPDTSGLAAIIQRIEARLRQAAEGVTGVRELFHIGAFELGPANLAWWLIVDSDAEKTRLIADGGLEHTLRALLAEEGYPAEAIPHVGLAIESRETVDRDFEGNLWYAIK